MKRTLYRKGIKKTRFGRKKLSCISIRGCCGFQIRHSWRDFFTRISVMVSMDTHCMTAESQKFLHVKVMHECTYFVMGNINHQKQNMKE